MEKLGPKGERERVRVSAQSFLRFEMYTEQAFTSSDMGSVGAGPSAADPASTASLRTPWRFWGYLLFSLSSAIICTARGKNKKSQLDTSNRIAYVT